MGDQPTEDGAIFYQARAGWAAGTDTLRIGVTGHRFLPDAQLVARQIDECLQHLMLGARAGERRLVAVSSLAEGADRLLAEAVLAQPGGALEAALPLPPEDYLRDFATAASREEFAALLPRALEVIVLPPPRPATMPTPAPGATWSPTATCCWRSGMGYRRAGWAAPSRRPTMPAGPAGH